MYRAPQQRAELPVRVFFNHESSPLPYSGTSDKNKRQIKDTLMIFKGCFPRYCLYTLKKTKWLVLRRALSLLKLMSACYCSDFYPPPPPPPPLLTDSNWWWLFGAADLGAHLAFSFAFISAAVDNDRLSWDLLHFEESRESCGLVITSIWLIFLLSTGSHKLR